jgi:hypothetical protein
MAAKTSATTKASCRPLNLPKHSLVRFMIDITG